MQGCGWPGLTAPLPVGVDGTRPWAGSCRSKPPTPGRQRQLREPWGGLRQPQGLAKPQEPGISAHPGCMGTDTSQFKTSQESEWKQGQVLTRIQPDWYNVKQKSGQKPQVLHPDDACDQGPLLTSLQISIFICQKENSLGSSHPTLEPREAWMEPSSCHHFPLSGKLRGGRQPGKHGRPWLESPYTLS
nr:uncharacterized protein LOC108407157 isoform X2 [Manis javanica]